MRFRPACYRRWSVRGPLADRRSCLHHLHDAATAAVAARDPTVSRSDTCAGSPRNIGWATRRRSGLTAKRSVSCPGVCRARERWERSRAGSYLLDLTFSSLGGMLDWRCFRAIGRVFSGKANLRPPAAREFPSGLPTSTLSYEVLAATTPVSAPPLNPALAKRFVTWPGANDRPAIRAGLA